MCYAGKCLENVLCRVFPLPTENRPQLSEKLMQLLNYFVRNNPVKYNLKPVQFMMWLGFVSDGDEGDEGSLD